MYSRAVTVIPKFPHDTTHCKAPKVALQRVMKNNNKTKHWPSAAISLLAGKPKKNTAGGASVAKPKAKKPRGHFVPILIRYRTYLRHGSGVKIISERFEESRKWVPATKKARVR